MKTAELIEEWREVKGYEDYYEVSNYGNIRTKLRIVKMKNGAIRTQPPRLMKVSITNCGYYMVGLNKDYVQKQMSVHRLVALHFIDNPENKNTVNHKNGIKTDNRVENLEWCTNSENHIHAFKLGLRKPPYKEATHGTITGYGYHKCRCNLCVEAYRMKMKRDWQIRKHKKTVQPQSLLK